MHTSSTRSYLLIPAVLLPLFFLGFLLSSLNGNLTRTSAQVLLADPELSYTIGPNLSFVELENSELYVRFAAYFEESWQFSIQDFIMKRAPLVFDQAGQYLDSDSARTTIRSVTAVYDGPDKITLRFVWNLRDIPSRSVTHEYTLYANARFLEIHYLDIDYGLHIVHMGQPGGTTAGKHTAYGGDTWYPEYHPEWPSIWEGYVTYGYTPTVNSYYNRYPLDGVNDPRNGGPLNYHGYFITGVYNHRNNVGFGQVLPVSSIEITKLLMFRDSRRGMEFLHFGPPTGFKGYLYPVTGGPSEIIALGKQLADGKLGSYSQSNLESDDFNRCTWTSDRWTFVDPLSDAGLAIDGTQISITVPAGVDHDIWGTGPVDFANNAPHVLQPAADTDFEVEVKFDSPVSGNQTMQGIVVKQNANNLLRFDFIHDSGRTKTFIGGITNGAGASLGGQLADIATASTAPLYMRVRRQGDLWTMYYSLDGSQWTIYASVAFPLTVTEVGLFAGNTSETPGAQPAFTSLIDYFFNTASPIDPEDSVQNDLTIHIVGQGEVSKTPDQPIYACHEIVSLSAHPPYGWDFAGWSGDLNGLVSPQELTITGRHAITATFLQAPTYTLSLTIQGEGSVEIGEQKDSYLAGEAVTLTASPAPGWRFSGWSGDYNGLTTPLHLTITKDTFIHATFTRDDRLYIPFIVN